MAKKKLPARPRPGGDKKKGSATGDAEIRRQKKLEEALRESEQKFAKIFRNNAAAIALTRLRDGMILDVNEKWQEIFGHSRREVVGKNSARNLVLWKDPQKRNKVFRELKSGKSIQNQEFEFVKNNGETWTALTSSDVIQLQDEPVIISSLLDISALKRVEEENRSLAKFPSENPNPVLRLSPQGTVLYANTAARKLLEPENRGQRTSVLKTLRRLMREAYAARSPRTIDIDIADHVYAFDFLPLAGVGYINIYGRDETEHRRDEAALRASEERYHSLFDKMSEGFALHEVIFNKKNVPVDSRFLEVNAAFEELSGLKREAVIGHLFTEMLPKDNHHFIKVLAKVARTGKPIHFKDYISTLDKHYDVTAFSSAPGQFAVLFTDVSMERKREKELEKLNRTFKALSNASQAMMQATDEAGYLKDICRIIVRDCGYRMAWIGYRENDREKNVRPVAYAGFEKGYLKTLRVTWADRERGRGPTGTAIRTGKPVICPNMLEDRRFAPWREEARRRGYISSLAIPLLADGRAFGAITIYSQEPDPFLASEVELLLELAMRLAYGIRALRLRREHALAEEALRVSLTKYQVLFDSFPLGISITDEAGNLIESNRLAERLLGVAKVEHERRKVDGKEWRIVRTDGMPMPAAEFASVRALKERRLVENVEMGMVNAGGDTTWINVSAAPIPLKGFGVAVTYGDISERKRIEEALRETSNYLEKLLNYANAPIIVWDPRFRIIRFNHAFERLTGYDAAQVRGKPLAMLFPAASKNASLKLIRDTLKGRQWEIVEIPILQKGGDIRTVLWNSANILDKDGAVVATIAQGQDISERKQAEKMLQNSLEILRIAQNAAKAGMWSWDMVSGEITWSAEFYQLFGIDPAAGASFANWLAVIHPGDRETAMANIKRAIEQRIPLENEYRIVLPGGEQRWIIVKGNTYYDKSGKPLQMSGICIDNTDHKRTEKQVEESLHEKETLLRELYHRTKNNMNIISSLVALQASAVDDLNMQRMFADMQSRIRTMSLVHEKLYQSQDLSNLDMREYIGDLAKTILAGYKNSAARIALDLDIESVAFSIDAAIPCGLVINELMTNSLKYAFPEEMTGRIGISLRMSPGEEATLCYKDNGIGFPDGFEPMQATSLGLKMVHNLVKKQLLGTIEFVAVQGMRAVITFRKPAAVKPERP